MVFLGDLVDEVFTTGKVRVDVMDVLQEGFWHLREFKKVVLVGNHDRVGTGHGLGFLRHIPNTHLVTEYQPWTKEIGLVPNGPKQEMLKWLNQAKADGVEVIFGHFALEGALGDNGHPLPRSETLPLAWAKEFKWWYLGHVHTPQVRGNVRYVGTPLRYSWHSRDRGERKVVVYNDVFSSAIVEYVTDTKLFLGPTDSLDEVTSAPKGSFVKWISDDPDITARVQAEFSELRIVPVLPERTVDASTPRLSGIDLGTTITPDAQLQALRAFVEWEEKRGGIPFSVDELLAEIEKEVKQNASEVDKPYTPAGENCGTGGKDMS